jgi:hypothetical protein
LAQSELKKQNWLARLWMGQSMAQQKSGKNLQAKFWPSQYVEKIGQPKIRK